MERSTYPFPLAVNSSHHSHYHRFLLGADPSILAPFPKPYCLGKLAAELGPLAGNLSLQRWRKLYHASFPWVEGFGPVHYDIGNVAPHRPLPREYCRPSRRFGAFDFVQVADPSVSALALVAGDRRIIERFVSLSDDFCGRVEAGAASRRPPPSGNRTSGRIIAGQFAEPNNRWLMPFLHVHSRVLNFTSFPEAPAKLDCVDPGSLARAALGAKRHWIARQADLLVDLGYRAAVRGDDAPLLRVEGVCPRLIAAIEAPRIAVMRILERAIVGDRHPSAEHFAAELPPEVIAAMADQLESAIARSVSYHKPAKVEIPSEGPWRGAVREHLSHYCPGSLEQLDRTALRAKATPLESPLFPTPQLDPAHCHAPRVESLDAPNQLPIDPDLGAARLPEENHFGVPSWLAHEFMETLAEVNERIVSVGADDPLVALRGIFARIDHLTEGAEPSRLRQSDILLWTELDGRDRDASAEAAWERPPGLGHRERLAPLEELFQNAGIPRLACEREIGGHSL
jgi:TrwC relaxase